jgi:Protein of unknown function (DUF2911)
MKKIAIPFFAALLLTVFQSFAQIKTPAASPSIQVTQEFGISKINLAYSRPGVKGRKVFGDFIPYGQVWRTGANTATTLEFADEVTLNGNKLAAGKYALFTIPNKEEWTVILSSAITWGAMGYEQKNDVLRFTAKPKKSATPIETFAIDFQNFTNNSVTMEIKWDNVILPITIATDVDTKVMASIDAAMKADGDKPAGVYFQAAQYYFDNKKDLKQALEWVNISVEKDPNPYWVLRLKSRIQAELKDYKGAIETAKLSMKKAEEGGNQEYVRFNKEAIAMWEKAK